MQNGGLASGIANSLGKIATMGLAQGIFCLFNEYCQFQSSILLVPKKNKLRIILKILDI